MNRELKPCKCGQSPEIIYFKALRLPGESYADRDKRCCWRIWHCGIEVFGKTEEKVIQAWNNRKEEGNK